MRANSRSVEDLVDTLSLTAAQKIATMVLKTPANWGESVLTARVQAFVREALVSAVQLPELPETRCFRMNACGVVLESPQVFAECRCTGFTLLGTDYISAEQDTLQRTDTTIWFLAFADVGQEIARNVRKGDQLELAAWARTSMSPREPVCRNSELTLIVETFRFRRSGPGGRRKRASPTSSSGEVRGGEPATKSLPGSQQHE